MSWPPPSDRVRELIRLGAQRALNPPQTWVEELDAAVFDGPARQIAGDPDLAAAARRAILSILSFWIAANIEAPGEPVPASATDSPLALARDLVRRGLDESALDGYRVGQNIAWRHWMEIAFGLTEDPAELRELLDVSARSIAAFLDDTVAEISEQMRAERDDLTRGANAQRREVVALVLAGAPIAATHAGSRLGYALDREHHAAVVWSTAAHPDVAAIDRVTEELARPTRSTAALTVAASTGTRWVWTTAPWSLEQVAAAVEGARDVRVALAGPATGVEGFRRVHLDALATQRLLDRLQSQQRVATYEQIALVALAGEDRERAARFVTSTLGALEHADVELREAVRAYVRNGCQVTATAAALYTHRNSLLRRLKKAEALLPAGLADRTVEVAVALDLVHWRGGPPA